MHRVLTLNAGSSSLKVALFEGDRRLLGGSVERIGLRDATLALDRADGAREPIEAPDHARALAAVLGRIAGDLGELAAVGHRVVHGGPRNDRAVVVDDEVRAELQRLGALDPDHMPAAVAVVDAMRARGPSPPQVACFDTAFHRALPRVARLLPLPRRFEGEGVRRYGFHGLSYTFLMEELARVAGPQAARGKVVLAHLGSGASLAAVAEGLPVETTMGFTPNSGVLMGTRSGDLDPGVLLYLMRAGGLGVDALDEMLSARSGLLGVSETSPDMRDLLAREAHDARAADAVALFCHHVKKAVGALAAALDGLDTLVFSGGIGERAAAVRARVAGGLGHLGVRLDPKRNEAHDAVISAEGAACTVRVIRTDEESIIARDTLRVLAEKGRTP